MGVVTMKGVNMERRQGRSCISCWWGAGPLLAAAGLALVGGCQTPSAHTTSRNYALRKEFPVDPPGAAPVATDDVAQGGRLYKQYCGSCHNARPLGERPLSNYHVAVAHMRDQAYLTGKEYRQIILFLRRWQDVGPPTPDVAPSPKRLVFSRPIAELKKEAAPPAGAAAAPAPPADGLPPAID
jgi:mono/diheme cytochrome c family protein